MKNKHKGAYFGVAIISIFFIGYAMFVYQDLQSNHVNANATPITFTLGEKVTIGSTGFTVISNDGSLTALSDVAEGSYTVAESQGALSNTSSYGTLGSSYMNGKLSIPSTGDLSEITDTTTKSLTTVPVAGQDWWLSDASVDNRSKFVDENNSLAKAVTNKTGIYENGQCGSADKNEEGLKPTGNIDPGVEYSALKNDTGTVTMECEVLSTDSSTGVPRYVGDGWVDLPCAPTSLSFVNGKLPASYRWVAVPWQVALSQIEKKANATTVVEFQQGVDYGAPYPDLRNTLPIKDKRVSFGSNSTVKYTITSVTADSEDGLTTISCDGISQTPGTSAIRPLVRIPSEDILYANNTPKSYAVSNKVTGTFPVSGGSDKGNLVLSNSDISISLDSSDDGVQGNKYTTVLPEDYIVSIPVQWNGSNEGTRYVSAKVGDKYTVLGALSGDKGSVDVDVRTLSDDIDNADSVSLTLFAEDSGSGSTGYMDGGTDVEISFETIDSVSLKNEKDEAVSSIIYGDVVGGGTIGTFSISTSTGVNSDATFQFVDDEKGTNPSSTNGNLEINGTALTIQTGKKLNVGTHAFFIKSTSKNGTTDVRPFSVVVTQRNVLVDTLIDSKATASYNIGGTFPSSEKFGYTTVDNTSIVDELTAVYSFMDSKNNVASTENIKKTTGTYTLQVKFVDASNNEDSNYKFSIKNAAKLTVSSHSITAIALSKTTYTYGDTGTKSGDVVGDLSITTDDGNGQSDPSFIISDSEGNAIAHDDLEIVNQQLVVKSGKKLNAKTYEFYVTATSSDTSIPKKTAQLSVVVSKKKITVSVKDPSEIKKKTGEALSKLTLSYVTNPALIGDDTLAGTAEYVYESGYTDTSLGTVKIKVKGLTSTNYDITFASASINVTQRTLADTDYVISGTQNSDQSWYQDDITITISSAAKTDGFDEFINAEGVSLGDTITLDTSKVYTNYAIQLRNSKTLEITSVARKTLSLDKTKPTYNLVATLPDGSAYSPGNATDQTITVTVDSTNTNTSTLTYYMSSEATAAQTTSYADLSNPAYEWEAMNSKKATFDDNTNGEKTYYFIVASKSELIGDVASIQINNTKKIQNPSGLNWNDAANMEIKYGEAKDISVNMSNVTVVYTLTDDQGNDASECLTINKDSNTIEAISGTCDGSAITLSAQVGNYATPLTKQIIVKKAPLTLEAVYEQDSVWKDNASIIKNDNEPIKTTRIASGTSLVGDEKTLSGAEDLGTYQYIYKDSKQVDSTTLDTSIIGTYTVTPSFQQASITDLDDKYSITWKPATITINTINIPAKDLYKITGTKKKGFEAWYSGDVTITPIHSSYGNMSVDDKTYKYHNNDPYVLTTTGTHSVKLTFDDNSGIDDHIVSYTETIKLDQVKPKLEISATSDGSAYVSGTETNSKIIISSISQPKGEENVSKATYYYTLDEAAKDQEPFQADGTLNNKWVEVSGRIEVEKEKTFYFKAVSGAGVSGDVVTFHANYVEIDTTSLPTVMITSEGKSYTADGSWTKHDVTFTLSGSTTGYEVCSSDTSINPKDCTWSDISDMANGKHEIVANVNQMNYWFRIKHNTASYNATKAYVVSLDTEKPKQPEILTKMKNDSTFSQIINALTFGNFFNKELEVSISSKDDESGINRIEYDLYDLNGKKVDHKTYLNPLRYQNAQYEIRATAWDNAGNMSEESVPVFVEVDTIKPVIIGVEDRASYYLPRFVTLEEQGSGINQDETIYKNSGSSYPLHSGSLFKGHGDIQLYVKDYAGNVTELSFSIIERPSVDELTKTDEDRQIIKDIEQEYKEIKDHLSAEECKEIEDWIKQAKEQTTVYVNSVKESNTNIIVEGIDGTTFDDQIELVVEIVTTELEMEQIDLSNVQGLDEDTEIKDAYDIYLKMGDEKIQPNGKVRVKIPYTEKEKEIEDLKVVYIDDENKATIYSHEIITDEAGEWISFETTHFSHYALVGKAKDTLAKNEVNIDTDEDGLPDVNLDFDGDGVPELNIDTNLDMIPDVDIDTVGDGKADVNIDVDTDGIADENIKKITNWNPQKNCEYQGMKYDTMGESTDQTEPNDQKNPDDQNNSKDPSTTNQNDQVVNTATKTTSNQIGNGASVKTGDETYTLFYMLLMIGSFVSLFIFTKHKRNSIK